MRSSLRHERLHRADPMARMPRVVACYESQSFDTQRCNFCYQVGAFRRHRGQQGLSSRACHCVEGPFSTANFGESPFHALWGAAFSGDRPHDLG